MKKKSITLLTIALFALHTTAQNVSDSEAYEVASKFMAKKGITLVNDDKATTRGNAEPYSIFNGEEGKGFAIVVNGAVVGYSTENTADVGNLPSGLKELLSVYSRTVTRTRGNVPDWFTPREVTPIQPLIKSRWNQCSPYNDLLERKTGCCVAITNGQILRYFRIKECKKADVWGADGDFVDFASYFNLPYTTFNHDLILDEYYETSSEESRKEVAKFMRYVEATIGYCDNVDFQTALDVEWKSYTANKERYEQFKDWKYQYRNSIDGYVENTYIFFDENLENGVPIRVDCHRGHEYHAFILDGRDSWGFYHLNWGWGGSYDGFYAISDNDVEREIASTGFFFSDSYIVIKPKNWTSSISDVKRDKTINGAVYNLQGQKVGDALEGLPKGVYIQNGKKRVVK